MQGFQTWDPGKLNYLLVQGRIQGEGVGGAPPPEMTCGFLIQLVFCKKKTLWFITVEVEQETSAPSAKKNPGSAPVVVFHACTQANNDMTLVRLTCFVYEEKTQNNKMR